MLSPSVVFVYVAALAVLGFCCRPKEYSTSSGQCCPMCHEGTVVRRDCTHQSGTRCSPCDKGTFMNQPNGLNKCFPCTSCERGQGLFVKQECTTTSDTVCDVLNGYFCKSLEGDNGCSLAEKHTQCEAGQRIKQPGTSRTDTVCETCQSGTFSLDGVNCTDWTICSETQVKVKEGTTSSDVVCGAATRNHYTSIVVFSLLILSLAGIFITGTLTKEKQQAVFITEGQRTEEREASLTVEQ